MATLTRQCYQPRCASSAVLHAAVVITVVRLTHVVDDEFVGHSTERSFHEAHIVTAWNRKNAKQVSKVFNVT